MLAAIGDAKTCPHGHPINAGKRIDGVPLADVEVGARSGPALRERGRGPAALPAWRRGSSPGLRGHARRGRRPRRSSPSRRDGAHDRVEPQRRRDRLGRRRPVAAAARRAARAARARPGALRALAAASTTPVSPAGRLASSSDGPPAFVVEAGDEAREAAAPRPGGPRRGRCAEGEQPRVGHRAGRAGREQHDGGLSRPRPRKHTEACRARSPAARRGRAGAAAGRPRDRRPRAPGRPRSSPAMPAHDQGGRAAERRCPRPARRPAEAAGARRAGQSRPAPLAARPGAAARGRRACAAPRRPAGRRPARPGARADVLGATAPGGGARRRASRR